MYRIWNIYALAAIGTIGGMLFGFDISSMSAWIGSDQYLDYFNSPGSTEQGGITASMSAGSFVGALVAGGIADKLGRRKALMIACLFWIAGAVLQCSAQNVGHLIVGRVVSGVAVGITSSQVLVYLAELAPSDIRGRIVGIQQWSIEWGILIMYLISYGCSVGVDGPAAFRIAWGVQAVPGFILLAGLFFFPESPRWLAQHDRWEEAHYNLAHLHAGGDLDSPLVIAEMEEVREAVRIARESKDIGYLGLFAPGVWKRTVVGVSVQIWQQLLGGNVMLYYLVYIFNMAGMTGNTALTSSIIQYVIFLVTTGVVLPYIDRLGRRPLLISGALICGVLHFTSGAVMAVHGYPVDGIEGNDILTWAISGAPAKAVIALAYIFVGVYGLTWAPVAWIYASEVFPLKYRAKGVGLAASGNWIFNLALAFFVPPSFTNIQWQTYMIFGTFCIAMTFHAFFTYPETARKTLEEVDVLFESNVPAWRSAKASGGFDEKVQEAKQIRLSVKFGVESYYAFRPAHNFLKPDRNESGPSVLGTSILAMTVKFTKPPSSIFSRPEKPAPRTRASTGSGESNNGAVYLLYHPNSSIEVQDHSDGEELAPEAKDHVPGRLHPRCNEGFLLAKIADNLKELGKFNKEFRFLPITKTASKIHCAQLFENNEHGLTIGPALAMVKRAA
ncbi:High-affinity glucose transporter [Fusarium oxysporum]|nr:High-affinity glucose transporter [Fusarium oxysporum]